MDIHGISRSRFLNTITWAIVSSAVVVAIAAGLARATLNLNAAVIEKPDIAIYLLLPDEEIHGIEVLREEENRRDYLANTKEGPKLVIMKRNEDHWYVAEVEPLHE